MDLPGLLLGTPFKRFPRGRGPIAVGIAPRHFKWAQEFLDVNPDESLTRDQSNLIPDLPSHLDTPYLVSTQTEPYFWGPTSVNLDAQGRLYVTESSRHRVQIYQK